MILDGRRLTPTEYLRLMINLETEDVGDIDTYVVGLALSLLPPPPAPTLIKIPPEEAAKTDVDHDRGPLEGLARPVLAMLVRAEDEVGV